MERVGPDVAQAATAAGELGIEFPRLILDPRRREIARKPTLWVLDKNLPDIPDRAVPDSLTCG